MQTEKFLVEYQNQIQSCNTIEESISFVKDLSSKLKKQPFKIQEVEGLNFSDFSYSKVRSSLKLRGKVSIRFKDKSIIYIYKKTVTVSKPALEITS